MIDGSSVPSFSGASGTDTRVQFTGRFLFQNLERPPGLTLTALVLWTVANAYAFMTFEFEGQAESNLILSGVFELYVNGVVALYGTLSKLSGSFRHRHSESNIGFLKRVCASVRFPHPLIGIGTRYGFACSVLFLFSMPFGDAIAQQRDPESSAGNQVQSQQQETASAETQAKEEVVTDATPSEAEQRELGANEDPMAASAVQRDVQRAEDAEGEPERTTGFDVYGSVRIRYRDQGEQSGWQDGGSRVGVEADGQFVPGSFLVGRYEMGFNLLTGLDVNKNRGDFTDTIFTRLFYVGLDGPNANLIVGKNWSPYYEVSGFTDRFQGAGGLGVGTYNAQTDGGPTGTGRSDRAVQGKLSLGFLPHTVFKPFDLNLQLQHGNSIPFGNGADYGTAVGLSAVMKTKSTFAIGLGYNYASIDIKKDPSLSAIGLTGPAHALLLGTRAFGDRWYAGFTVARLHNHETTDEGIYFDGWGSEFYGQYRMTKHLWFVGGYNILEPDSDQAQAGDFRRRFAILGLRHTFGDKGFRFMVFANVQLNDGRNAAGTHRSNVYTVGVRWDWSRRGWHMAK